MNTAVMPIIIWVEILHDSSLSAFNIRFPPDFDSDSDIAGGCQFLLALSYFVRAILDASSSTRVCGVLVGLRVLQAV